MTREENAESVAVLVEFGYPLDQARFLALDRSLTQINLWVGLSGDKENPDAYFRACHRKNQPVYELVKGGKADTARESEQEARIERRRRCIADLMSPEHRWQVDERATCISLLEEYGFHPIAAAELSHGVPLERIIEILQMAGDEQHPWAEAREALMWYQVDKRIEDRAKRAIDEVVTEPENPALSRLTRLQGTLLRMADAVNARDPAKRSVAVMTAQDDPFAIGDER